MHRTVIEVGAAMDPGGNIATEEYPMYTSLNQL